MSTTAKEQEEKFCRYQGIMCEYATDDGYCKITGCAKLHELYGAYKGGDNNESIPDWQKEIEEEYEWLHWDIR